MEKRKEPRFAADQAAVLTILEEPRSVREGLIVNISGCGMRFATAEPVREGTAVQLECANTLLLGEVCYCQPAGNGYALGLRFEHALFDTAELARLSQQLIIGDAPQVVPSRR